MNDLSPYDFDQTHKGWPSLDRQGKYLGAATAIVSYIDANQPRIAKQNEVSIQTLFFHAGQEYAMGGKQYYRQAIEMMKKSYKSNEGWNEYVNGSIAFLSGDMSVLKVHANKLTELANENSDLTMNAHILWKFVDGIANDLSYVTIYDGES